MGSARRVAEPAALLAGVLISRLAYYAAGVRFDVTPLVGYVQYIDLPLLRHDLASSLWHLHTQPPLYNLYLGAILKVSGAHYVTAFHVTYVAAGMVLALSIWWLVQRLGLGRRWGAVVAFLFVASPPVVLYENWLYAEYLVAVAVIAAVACLVRFADGAAARWAVLAFSLLASVVLARTLFHLVWLVAVVAIVAALQAGRRREVLLAAAVPLALCAAVYGKNLVEWGTPSASTCSGVNLSHVSTLQLDLRERERLVADGELSRFALVDPYALPYQHPELLGRTAPTGVALLDRPVKSTGAPNFDAEAYDPICDHYLDDAATVIRTRPRAFAKGVGTGTLIYMRPSSDYSYLHPNADRISGLERGFAVGALGQFRRVPVGRASAVDQVASIAWFVVIAYAVALAAAVAAIRKRAEEPGAALLGAVFVTTFVWITLVGNLLDQGENNRFRLALDPLAWVLLVAWATPRLRRLGKTLGDSRAAG